MLAWADGQWACDPAAAAEATALCLGGWRLPLTPTGPDVVADAADPRAAVAVMRAVRAGSVKLTGNPPDLRGPLHLDDGAFG